MSGRYGRAQAAEDCGPGPSARIGLMLGPLAALAILLLADLDPARPQVTRMAAIAAWMALWWITEAVPLAVTALLPVVLYPVLGIMAGRDVAPVYFNSIIFLFLGGFVVAIAMERWLLHKRIALGVILAVGGHARGVLLGFMVAAAFLSMWVSNTATTMMMVPICVAVIRRVEKHDPGPAARRFGVALLLGTAYGASTGGLATLIGTPPNPLFVSNLSLLFPEAPEISFASWMVLGLPLSVLMLLTSWLVLTLIFRLKEMRGLIDRTVFAAERAKLGPMSWEEKVVLADFVSLAVLWLTRGGLDVGWMRLPGWSEILPHGHMIDDGTVAIVAAVVLFMIPSRSRPGRVMDWPTARWLPWGIVLLFGGGFALAKGFVTSELTVWLGERLAGLSSLPPLLLVVCVCLLITFVTELTSNTATTQMALPVLAAVSAGIGVNPLLLMVPATLSASCAFMLPVATPPNAIIFGTERVRVADMARAGLLLNLAGAVLITLCVYFLGEAAFGCDMTAMPDWAAAAGR